jgi:F-type H+-transporting ATPase subunit b
MTTTTTTTEAAAEVAHEAAKAGMPQLDFSTFPNQIFWLVVTLLVIYFALSRIALPRIGGVLAQRAGAITSDLSAAEELKQKAVSAEKAYNEALVQARVEASKIVGAAKSAESEKAIAEIRAGAAQAVTEVAQDTAKELVAALGGKADANVIAAAVSARLKG